MNAPALSPGMADALGNALTVLLVLYVPYALGYAIMYFRAQGNGWRWNPADHFAFPALLVVGGLALLLLVWLT